MGNGLLVIGDRVTNTSFIKIEIRRSHGCPQGAPLPDMQWTVDHPPRRGPWTIHLAVDCGPWAVDQKTSNLAVDRGPWTVDQPPTITLSLRN